jgi:hypothetical protein
MIKWIKSNRNAIIRNSFLLPILLVVIMSISHVISWYDLGNPMSWAIYLSVAIEIFALASVSASSIKMKRGSIWFLFGLVTVIQIIGNIFYEFNYINPTGENFIAWMELINPMFEDWEVIDHRRFLATIQGGTLPIMSLTALHFYIKFNDLVTTEETPNDKTKRYFDARNRKMEEIVAANSKSDEEIITEGEKMKVKKAMDMAAKIRKERESNMTDEEIAEMHRNEPTALAFTQSEEQIEKSKIDKAAEIDARIDAELKKAAEDNYATYQKDENTKDDIDKTVRDSRETTPIYSKQIDPKTGKFVHKKIDQTYGNS